MRILITGICGFAGSTLARELLAAGHRVTGLDNFIRPGSELNREDLIRRGAKLHHADLRVASDLEVLPAVDWVIDAAANPSVLAGVDGKSSSRQLIEHNLGGTINMLEYCKQHQAGFTLLSTSRVYSIAPLVALPVIVADEAFHPAEAGELPAALSAEGVSEAFSTTSPVSLYGSTKLASELLALEYGETFRFPVFINRCGVLAGAGQFGRADQGIFAYWIHSYLNKKNLRYIGFDGQGHQVRDCLHPRDLAPLLEKQWAASPLSAEDRIINVSGGRVSSMSLRQLSRWCAARFEPYEVGVCSEPRPFDIPWMVLDSAKAAQLWNWQPLTPVASILEEIALHALSQPRWLEQSAPL